MKIKIAQIKQIVIGYDFSQRPAVDALSFRVTTRDERIIDISVLNWAEQALWWGHLLRFLEHQLKGQEHNPEAEKILKKALEAYASGAFFSKKMERMLNNSCRTPRRSQARAVLHTTSAGASVVSGG